MWRFSTVALLVALLASTAFAGGDPADYFPLKVGYSWKYIWSARGQKQPYTVTVLDYNKKTGLWLVQTKTGDELVYNFFSKPAGWVMLHSTQVPHQGQANYQPVKKLLKNPLVTGATWFWNGDGMDGAPEGENFSVAGLVSIPTPSGKFTCMRIVSETQRGGVVVRKNSFYANHVGLVQEVTITDPITATSTLLDYSFRPRR